MSNIEQEYITCNEREIGKSEGPSQAVVLVLKSASDIMSANKQNIELPSMEHQMRRRNFISAIMLAVLVTIFSPAASAQFGVCEAGNGELDSAKLKDISTDEIIQKFAAKETLAKAARAKYSYTQSISVQELSGNEQDVAGEFNQVAEVSVDSGGRRVERPTFAPANTLRSIQISSADIEDIKDRLPFAVTAEELPQFNITYVGRQQVDELKTYVFDVTPKNPKKEKQMFRGKIWVDDRDLVIVKTCGKTREDVNANSTKRNQPRDLVPTFVTYREQIDGQYWFPTYCKANEVLHFGLRGRGDVHFKEIIKYTNYKLVVTK